MSGSRKGERRGGAKPGHVRKTAKPAIADPAAAVKRKAGRPPGSPNKKKPRIDPEVISILNKRGVSIADREREVEMYFTVVGRRERLPKDVLLNAMRYFEESAIEYSEVLRANLEAAAKATGPQAQAVMAAAVSAAEAQVDKYVSMAADVAFKAAPFVHPRLAALITNPGGDRSAGSLLDLLMRDLDEAGKPARYIDHDAGEVAK
jgi:hypothetical protein